MDDRNHKDDMGGPAFPCGNPEQGGHPGEVTLWDYYAAAVLGRSALMFSPDVAAEKAAEYADAMLAERAKRTEGK